MSAEVTDRSPWQASGECPDGLEWCHDHTTDADGGQWHRTGTTTLNLPEGVSHSRGTTLSAQGERLHDYDGTVSPIVWVHYAMDVIELTPAAALAFGRALVASAEAVAA